MDNLGRLTLVELQKEAHRASLVSSCHISSAGTSISSVKYPPNGSLTGIHPSPSRWAHTVKSSAKRASCNIYDPDFQAELSKLGFSLRMNNHPPQEGGAEEEFILASKGAKRVDWSLGPEAGLAAASIKGQWQFEHGKRDALLIMCCPRLRYLPPNVILDTLYKVPKLRDKWLVTSVHIYPAFSMYLSNKCMRALSAWRGIVDPRSYTAGEKVSLALVGQVPGPVAATPGTPAGAEAGIGWWSDTDLLRKACDKDGNYCYTPLYTMKRPRVGWVQRLYREKEVEVTGDGSWQHAVPPWASLNEYSV